MSGDIVADMYSAKEGEYFSLERELFINAITGTNLTLLDVGCGTGALGKWFRTNRSFSVYGIEINDKAFKEAEKNLDGVIKGNIEMMELPYADESFDAIVMGDVLEHLIEPVAAVKKLLQKLKKGGQMYISVPNIRHWKEVLNLVFRDKWEYTPWGILDYTHLRFFTKRSIVALLEKNDIQVAHASWVIQNPSKSHIINKLTVGLLEGLLASHTFLVVKK